MDEPWPQRPPRAAQLFRLGPGQESPASSSRRPGVTIRELIEEFCGGMAEGHTFRAYLPGGASGGILPASMDDIPLDFGTLGEIRLLHRLGRGRGAVAAGRHQGRGLEPHALLRGRELRPVHAVPRRHAEGRRC